MISNHETSDDLDDSAITSEQSTLKLSVLIPVREVNVHFELMLSVLDVTISTSFEVLLLSAQQELLDQIEYHPQHQCQHIHKIQHSHGRDLSALFRDGFQQANGDYVLIFAADEVGPAVAVEDMLILMDEGCDMVSLTRYAYGGKRYGGSRSAYHLSRLANTSLRILSGIPLSDYSTALKMIRRDKYHDLDLMARHVGWAPVFELSIKAALAGWRLGEVPLISVDRFYGGKSEFRLLTWTWEYLQWYLWGIWKLRTCKYSRSHIRVRVPNFMGGSRY